jgi:organic radical activating enzyme
MHSAMIKKKYLEVYVADHCNLRCTHCSHFSPYLAPRLLPIDSFQRDLDALGRVMTVERLRFLGGKPLLNRNLISFIQAVRKSKFARIISVCTNGTLLGKQRIAEVLDAIDVLDLSVYPGTTPGPDEIVKIAHELSRKHGFKLRITRKPEFRYDVLDKPIEDPALVKKIYASCQIAHGFSIVNDGCHTIYDGHYYKCARPVYTLAYLRSRRIPVDGLPDYTQVDGVCLHAPDLGTRLRTYIDSPEPLRSCDYCLGTAGIMVENRQMEKDEILNPVPNNTEPLSVIDARQMDADFAAIRRRKKWRRTSNLAAQIVGAFR